MTFKPRIKYLSLFGPAFGYAEAAWPFLQALSAKQVDFSWRPFLNRPDLCKEPYKSLRTYAYKPLDYDIAFIHTMADFANTGIEEERERKKFIAVYTTWETTNLPDSWVEILNKVNLVLVPCSWNKECFQKSGVETPVEVLPHILNAHLKTDKDHQLFDKTKPYVFYNLGEFSPRKGQIETLEAYLESFTADDPVVLRIKTSPRYYFSEGRAHNILQQVWKSYPNPAKVELYDFYLPNQDLKKLCLSSHSFVSLTKAEGWGLGGFEAAGLAKPVLMAKLGGPADFLPADYGYGIDYTMAKIPFIKLLPNYFGWWAEPSKKSAGALMQKLVEDYFHASSWEETETYKQGLKLHKYVQEHFSSETVITRLLHILEHYYYKA